MYPNVTERRKTLHHSSKSVPDHSAVFSLLSINELSKMAVSILESLGARRVSLSSSSPTSTQVDAS